MTAAEREDRALDVLRRQLVRRHIRNVTPLCTDVLAYTPSVPFDAMVFCFFGSMDEILSVARSRCRGTVIAVKRDHRDHRFTVTKQSLEESHGVAAAEARLTELNIPYELKRTAYRFDQPFRDWEEARLFFETYRRRDDASLITDGFLREKLEPTVRGYLSFKRQKFLRNFLMKQIRKENGNKPEVKKEENEEEICQ